MWMEIDFTDLDDPVYVTVFELPELLRGMVAAVEPSLGRQFLVVDSIPTFDQPEFVERLTTHGNIMEVVNAMMGMMPELEALGESRYRMVATEQWLTDLMLAYIDMSVEMGTANLTAPLTQDALNEIIRRGTFLHEDWVMYVTLNEDGYIIQENSSGQFIYDLLEWVTITAEVLEDPSISEGALEAVLTITFEYSYTFENINTATSVPLPELTPENSLDITEMVMLML